MAKRDEDRCSAIVAIDVGPTIHAISEGECMKLQCYREPGHSGDHCAPDPTEMFGQILWPADLG